MGRHKGHPTPWSLLCEAALAYAEAESEQELARAEYRLRYAARFYRDDPNHEALDIGIRSVDDAERG